ncbi:MAG: VTT domain-containing protein [Bryobacterales bacterium]|nr:VTT domain-containing protein [Bryobacterales bacterium]
MMNPYIWCYLLLIASALIPWLNSEVIMGGMATHAASQGTHWALVLVATAGQMTGKCALYWAGRGALRWPGAQRKLQAWKQQCNGRRRSGSAVLFLSAVTGVPPFYPVSVLAGSLRIPFTRFLAIGACGRFLHYAVVVFGVRWVWTIY